MTDTNQVAQWYDANAALEDQRLQKFRLEHAISKRTIEQCIARPGLNVLDLGGGTGPYAIWLAEQHHVTLVDISAAELEYARRAASHVTLEIVQADARAIRQSSVFRENHYDLVLCQGPLYHLLEPAERHQLLDDCRRMCKPGGYVLTAWVTRGAHLRDVAQRDPERLLREAAFYRQYMVDGRYTRSNVSGYHASPTDVRAEVSQHFDIERIVACEGLLGGVSHHLERLDDTALDIWVDTVLKDMTETTLGAADHLLVVAKR